MGFFDGYGNAAPYYDLFADVRNLEFFLQSANGHETILDIGAGTGRMAIPLALEGKEVFCVEPSKGMRDVLIGKVKDRPGLSEKVHILACDASSFKIDVKFPFTMISGAFEHLMDNDIGQSMRNITAHMEEGGEMVFDVQLGHMGDMPLKMTDIHVSGGIEHRRYIGRSVHDGRVDYELVYEAVREGVIVDRAYQRSGCKITSFDEVMEVLRAFDLTAEDLYSGYGFEPFTGDEPLLIVRAKKT